MFVGRGLIGGLPRPGRRAFVVTDENVAAHYGAALSGTHHTITIAPGEEHKTLAVAERVWRELAARGMGRDDHLVALGGGVVGDLAGFCAATYQRGVPVVQVPTTVVAQVDSAYGGKTGVDLPEAKNYVGAYHQPAAVITDVDTLATLPPRGARRRLRGGRQDGADRRRAALGARRGRARRSTPRSSSRARARRSASSPPTSATAARASC